MSANKVSGQRTQDTRFAVANALLIARPEQLVLLLMFMHETIPAGHKVDRDMKTIEFFLRRAGGMHLLLLLLNAHYNKRAVGRIPGWGFGVLRRRIRISERSLRLLVADALELGLLIHLRGLRDRRVRVYCVAPVLVHAWERLFNRLCKVLPGVVAEWGPAQLADIDFAR